MADVCGCDESVALKAEVKRLRGALVLAVGVFDDAKGQWGSEYLWKKFGLDEAMKPAREALEGAEHAKTDA